MGIEKDLIISIEKFDRDFLRDIYWIRLKFQPLTNHKTAGCWQGHHLNIKKITTSSNLMKVLKLPT